jgi:hypothetical protein
MPWCTVQAMCTTPLGAPGVGEGRSVISLVFSMGDAPMGWFTPVHLCEPPCTAPVSLGFSRVSGVSRSRAACAMAFQTRTWAIQSSAYGITEVHTRTYDPIAMIRVRGVEHGAADRAHQSALVAVLGQVLTDRLLLTSPIVEDDRPERGVGAQEEPPDPSWLALVPTRNTRQDAHVHASYTCGWFRHPRPCMAA